MRSLMIINLDNLRNNVETIKKYTNKEMIAVVKSNAYGLGVKPIVCALIEVGIKYFACNTLSEAKVILSINTQIKIIILDSISWAELKGVRDFTNLVISINSFFDAYNINQINQSCTIHLQIDTGMNRVGIKNIDDARTIIKLLKNNPLIKIEGIFTHFTSNSKELFLYERQKQSFEGFLKLHPFSIIHTANTSSLTKTILGNYIRIGMALYGFHSDIPCLKKVVQVVTKCCNIISLKKGDEVGYDGTYIASKKARLGVLPIGYNDGEITPYVYNHSYRFLVVAKRCMNHTFILINDKINYLSYLRLFPKNDKIVNETTYYHLFTSMKKIPKIYIKQVDYDIQATIKSRNGKGLYLSKRVRSN